MLDGLRVCPIKGVSPREHHGVGRTNTTSKHRVWYVVFLGNLLPSPVALRVFFNGHNATHIFKAAPLPPVRGFGDLRPLQASVETQETTISLAYIFSQCIVKDYFQLEFKFFLRVGSDADGEVLKLAGKRWYGLAHSHNIFRHLGMSHLIYDFRNQILIFNDKHGYASDLFTREESQGYLGDDAGCAGPSQEESHIGQWVQGEPTGTYRARAELADFAAWKNDFQSINHIGIEAVRVRQVSLSVDGDIPGNGSHWRCARLRMGKVRIMPLQVRGQLSLGDTTLNDSVTRPLIKLDDAVHSLEIQKNSSLKRDSQAGQGQSPSKRHHWNLLLVRELYDLLNLFGGSWRHRIVRPVWFCCPEVPGIDEKLFRLIGDMLFANDLNDCFVN